MSLIRQIWLLVLGMVLTAFLGSFGVWMASARDYLQSQLQIKNSDNAQALALTLSQQRGEPALMELVLAAQYDTGTYRSIRLLDGHGRVVMAREASGPAAASGVPEWFVRLVHIDSRPGVAQVSDGWRALGRIEVVSHSSFAYRQLWDGSVRTAAWLALIGAVAGALVAWGVGRIRRPLAATVAQARALEERRFVTVPEPKVPELAQLTRAMNAVVMRLKTVFEEQSHQVELLRVQAHCDALTGLARRRHFIGQLDACLQREDGPAEGTLVLARLMNLTEANLQWGRRRTDELIRALGRAVGQAAGREGLAGRLNGGDLALSLPSDTDAQAAAEALSAALRAVCAGIEPQADVAVGAVGWRRGMSVHDTLAGADQVLARAESRGPFAVAAQAAPIEHARGAEDWRKRVLDAVAGRSAHLARFPVVARGGVLLHHECPLRLKLDGNPAHELASFWLPLVRRAGVLPSVDLLAAELALREIAADGLPRCTNISPASLADSTFVPRLVALLGGHRAAASSLWIEVDESAAVDRFESVRELGARLRPLGVRVGLEHTGPRLAELPRLFEAGLDYVKLDAAIASGVAEDADRAAHVRSTVAMLHGLGLKVCAEGVSAAEDIPALWACGVDAVTGTAVTLR
jgi:EAL domain-containing protein (putative c-di-GMP-specific phosphodiesterase class I)/GGDEF domain-containing protein